MDKIPLKFWCGDDKLHLSKSYEPKNAKCCLTHLVGLPEHPSTGIISSLTPFQVEFYNEIQKAVSKPNGTDEIEWKKLAHKFHVLKGRQMGFTEIVLRIIQYYCFNRYAGYKVGIIAGTTGALAMKDLRRFYSLFNNIKYTLESKEFKGNTITLINGTLIEAFKASEEALTGDTKFKCIFMDEAAKWKTLDDTPVFNSVMPIVRSNGSDLFLVSTPKRPIKMFYKIYNKPQDFVMLKYDIWRSEGNLYSKEQIQNMLETAQEDPNQEYLCKFVLGKNAALGPVTDDMKDDNEFEWDFNAKKDGYAENDSENDSEDVEDEYEWDHKR